jgi:uncharacterized repeat protein (TIGR01451 family)
MKTGIFELHWKNIFAVSAMVIVAAGLMLAGPAMAADNQGTGDIAGDSASLTDSNIFTLTSTTLALNKIAFLTDGTQLTSGDVLARGTVVQFVIYVDNTTAFPLTDVSVQDVLDPAFAYQAGSIKVDNSQATGAAQAAIYTAVNAGAAVTDAAGDDVASYDGTDTINVGNSVEATNTQLDVAASTVWAVIFNAVMQ